jgi:thiol peroxidase
MTERKGIITMRGRPLTLIGPDLVVGAKAPDFTALYGDPDDVNLGNFSDLKEMKLADFFGKVKVISVTPSLDTPVCDLQLRRFNQEAAKLPADLVVLNVSMDLPFAIMRFCTTAAIDKAKAISDHRDASFGIAYGVLIKELRLLARSIFILDKNDVLRYREIVPEQSNHPDYDKALAELKKITGLAKAA